MNALTRTMLDLSSTLTSIAVQQKPRVHVCSKRFYTDRLTGKPTMSAVVLVAGETYEVDRRQLSQLLDGYSPEDLNIEPMPEDECDD